jgi:hypothetical protein
MHPSIIHTAGSITRIGVYVCVNHITNKSEIIKKSGEIARFTPFFDKKGIM